jgi:nucleobase transporter 1/2
MLWWVLMPASCTHADIFNAIFSTGPAVALIITLILDNTIPGTREERGLHVWQQLDASGRDWFEDDHMNKASTLPCL